MSECSAHTLRPSRPASVSGKLTAPSPEELSGSLIKRDFISVCRPQASRCLLMGPGLGRDIHLLLAQRDRCGCQLLAPLTLPEARGGTRPPSTHTSTQYLQRAIVASWGKTVQRKAECCRQLPMQNHLGHYPAACGHRQHLEVRLAEQPFLGSCRDESVERRTK